LWASICCWKLAFAAFDEYIFCSGINEIESLIAAINYLLLTNLGHNIRQTVD